MKEREVKSMSKTVVLAEKPSVGRDLARVLKCHKKETDILKATATSSHGRSGIW
ncbi:hypothetical protein ACSE3M_13250 [Bacillus velezensis]